MRQMVATLLAGACAAACSTGASTAVPSPTNSSATSSDVTKAVQLKLQHKAAPGDDAGIDRNLGEGNGDACGVSSFTDASDRLAFMRPDSTVVLKDADGTIVGQTTLPTGVVSDFDPDGPAAQFTCTWSTSSLSRVPLSDFYTVEIATRQVGGFSRAELERQAYVVTIPLTPA